MSVIGYVAVERFDAESDGWEKYVTWAKLPQLKKVASLDTCLCPSVIKELSPEDWKHVVPSEFVSTYLYFDDLPYLLQRLPKDIECDIFALVEEPDTAFPHGFHDERFEFLGYDIFDGCVSSLTNCGIPSEKMCGHELNPSGLLPSFEQALDVQKVFGELYPDDHPGQSAIWPLWLMKRTK